MDLFYIIKSLSPAEKAYFRKFAGFHVIGEKNNYLRLFEYISKLDEYKDDDVKQHFRNEKFVKQLPVAKNYLYKTILESLRSFRKPRTKRDEIRILLEYVDILTEKRLFWQARKLLRRCRKICTEYELTSSMLQVFVAESKIAASERAYSIETDEIINKNYKHRKKYIDILNNDFEFDRIEYNVISLITQFTDTKDQRLAKHLRQLISDDLLSDESKALSLTAKLKYNHIFATYYYAIGIYDKCNQHLLREISLLSKNKTLLRDRIADYLILLSNSIEISLRLKEYNLFEKSLHEFRMFLTHKDVAGNIKLKFFITRNGYFNEITYYIQTGKFEKALLCYEKVLTELNQPGFNLSKSDIYNLNNFGSHIYFGLGDFSRSVEFVNSILNDPDSEILYGDLIYLRFYNLIVHYELGNFELLEHLIKSLYRKIIKQRSLYQFEKLVFNFLRRIPDAVDYNETNEMFGELAFAIRKIRNDPSLKDALRYFDFLSWLNSKKRGVPYARVLRENSKSNIKMTES